MTETHAPTQEHRPSVYAVAGGNHITILLDRDITDGEVDVIEVTAQPGGGPPPHRHSFAEWFQILEGELTFVDERDGVASTRVLRRGDHVFVEPWTVHATLNLSPAICRFKVTSRPGVMSGYARDAGVPVGDELAAPAHTPPGPAELREVAARWGIEFCSPEMTASLIAGART